MRSFGALLLCLVCTSSIAQAQGGGRERAAVLAREANDLYEQGEYRQAAVLLERAYALYPTPSLLYNLGRAFEEDGDGARAIDAYQRYLMATDGSDPETRIEVDNRILRLEQRLAESAPPDQGEPDPAPPDPSEPPPPDEGDELEPPIGAFVLGGGGAAGLAIAIGFGLSSWSLQDQYRPRSVDAATAAELEAEASTHATVANVFYVLGGLALAAGAIWAIVDLTSQDDGSSTSLRVGPGALALTYRWR